MSTCQVLQYLYSLGTASPNLPSYLYRLIQCDEEDQYLSGLQGSELTRLVDFLDEVLGVIPTTDDVFRKCLHKLYTICGRHMTLPSSHNISGNLAKVGNYPISLDGGTADVWEGTHGGRRVCIKSPRVCVEDLQTITRSFLKEAVIWKRLKHPNVVPFIGVTTEPLQFVSEYMPNGTLTKYVEKNPSMDRIGLLLDVAEGLNYLHTNYTIHGDLKGPNILIDHNGSARLTDFGLTSVVRGLNSVIVTKVKGYTTAWAAPEVLLEECNKTTPEADIFSFGMVAIEVFTGRYPFSGFTEVAISLKIIGGERPARPQGARALGLVDSVWDMTLSCWQQDPSRRPTVAGVVGFLRECYTLRATSVDYGTSHAPIFVIPSKGNPTPTRLPEIPYHSDRSSFQEIMPDPYPPDGLSPSGPHVHSGSVHAENHGTIRKRIGRLFVQALTFRRGPNGRDPVKMRSNKQDKQNKTTFRSFYEPYVPDTIHYDPDDPSTWPPSLESRSAAANALYVRPEVPSPEVGPYTLRRPSIYGPLVPHNPDDPSMFLQNSQISVVLYTPPSNRDRGLYSGIPEV